MVANSKWQHFVLCEPTAPNHASCYNQNQDDKWRLSVSAIGETPCLLMRLLCCMFQMMIALPSSPKKQAAAVVERAGDMATAR